MSNVCFICQGSGIDSDEHTTETCRFCSNNPGGWDEGDRPARRAPNPQSVESADAYVAMRGARPERQEMTARQIIESRLGFCLGSIATMPRDLRRALYLLALALNKQQIIGRMEDVR